MSNLHLTENLLDPNGYWDKPIAKIVFQPTVEDIALFDQNGYDLTILEQHFAYGNFVKSKKHRDHIRCLKEDWFVQEPEIEGAVLNHSLLFERKGYTGAALEQLKFWAKKLPILNKVIALRPKWGLDFSMDYADRDGNAFEVLHWEYDGFDYEEVQVMKLLVQARFATMDWQHAAEQILKKKDEWHHLDFFAQSEWKCNYFKIPKERFKMVAWQ